MSVQWLFDVICSRRENPSEVSYTSQLLAEGLPKIAQKVGEEATETVVAALAQDDHTLVLLAARNLSPADVLAELERRHRK